MNTGRLLKGGRFFYDFIPSATQSRARNFRITDMENVQ